MDLPSSVPTKKIADSIETLITQYVKTFTAAERSCFRRFETRLRARDGSDFGHFLPMGLTFPESMARTYGSPTATFETAFCWLR